MNIYSICSIALLLTVVSSKTIVVEPINQIQAILPVELPLCKAKYQCSTPSGCWTSCSHSQFDQCGDFFPALFKPSFCAYTKDDRYLSYTFSCQACQNTQVLAIRDGACSCDFIKCKSNQTCEEGQCVDLVTVNPINLCLTVKCSSGYFCKNGKCVSDVSCKRLCVIGFICKNDECVPDTSIDLCATVRCRQGYVCENGDCIQVITNACALIRCMQGFTCIDGNCVKNVDNICSTIKCVAGYSCLYGQCVPNQFDHCLNVQCQYGYSCRNGFCVRNIVKIDPCSLIKCVSGFQCKEGKCVSSYFDLCATIRCMSGYSCQNGRCVPVNLCATIRCANGYTCNNGQCVQVNACTAIRCRQGYYCENGQCIKQIQGFCNAKKIQCTIPRPNQNTCPTRYYLVAPTPTVCGITADGRQLGFPQNCDACKEKQVQYYFDRRCQQLQGCNLPVQCTCDQNCEYGLSCEAGKCINNCVTVKCWAGAHCFKGQCVLDTVIADPGFNTCATVSCLTGSKCVNGKCISVFIEDPIISIKNPCAKMNCIATTKCVNGKCVPLNLNAKIEYV